MYSMGACAVLGITNQDALSEDLESDPFLNSALQRFKCELYYRFGSFLAPLSKYAGLGAAIIAELMIGFWFGVGVMLAAGVADCLNHLVRAVTRGK